MWIFIQSEELKDYPLRNIQFSLILRCQISNFINEFQIRDVWSKQKIFLALEQK